MGSTRDSITNTPSQGGKSSLLFGTAKNSLLFGTAKNSGRTSYEKSIFQSAFRASDFSKNNNPKNYASNGISASAFKLCTEKNTSFTTKGDISMHQSHISYGRTNARQAAGYEPKTSACMQKFQRNTDTNQFWADINRIATHQNKIENLDQRIAKQRGIEIQEPIEKCTLDTRPLAQTPRHSISHFRGRGGIMKDMNGVDYKNPSGCQKPEHVLEGRAMSAIIKPPTDSFNRRSQSVQHMYSRASEQVGSNAEIFKRESVDPATLLRPDKNFRKASVASMGNKLWIEEKDMDLITDQQKSRYEMCKTKSRERYFQSQISTLPGPSHGLNCVKTRQQELNEVHYEDNV